MNADVCPTCGAFGPYPRNARVRRGRIVRVVETTVRLAVVVRGRRWGYLVPVPKGQPRRSLRVNWPITRYPHGASIAYCPDPWHEVMHSTDPLVDGRPSRRVSGSAEPYTGLNRHDPYGKGARRKAKARRHTERQSKARR